MHTFIKTQAVLIVGSLADFLTTILLVEVFHCWVIAGNAAGNIAGATAQFILSRNWAFNAKNERMDGQVTRFILMWIGSIIISSVGIYLITNYFNIHYLFCKLIVSILVGSSYTYLCSKKFVFT